MAPRAYRLGRRAETASATRTRIVDAAAALFQERGVNATTLQAVAERADVSRGTILHHFGGTTGLVDAVAERVLVELELPDDRILDGVASDEARLRAYVAEMVRFFRRSTGWWAVFVTEMERPELKAREADYYGHIARLQAAALGPLGADPDVNRIVGALMHPGAMGGLLWALEQTGLGPERVIEAYGDIVVAYVERVRTAPTRT